MDKEQLKKDLKETEEYLKKCRENQEYGYIYAIRLALYGAQKACIDEMDRLEKEEEESGDE